MKYLSFLDYIGPVIATIATIIALSSDYFSKKKYKVLFYYISISIAITALVFTLIYTSNSNQENQKNINEIRTNFNKIQKQNIESLKNDSIYRSQKDSLSAYIEQLKHQLITVSVNELRQEREIRKENQKILLDNLQSEIITDLSSIEELSDKHLDGFKNINSFVTGKLENQAMKEALNYPLSREERNLLIVIIRIIDSANESIENIKTIEPGDGKRQNIESLKRFNSKLKINLIELKTRLIKYN